MRFNRSGLNRIRAWLERPDAIWLAVTLGIVLTLPTLTGFVARVIEVTDDGRPAAARFEFRVPLEDPSLRWFCWKGQGYAPFVPPKAGETATLPPVNLDEVF